MIYGNINDQEQLDYICKHNEDLQRAFSFLKNKKYQKLETGRVSIPGTELFGFYLKYDTKPAEGRIWEAHRKYLDLQYLAEGSEKIACSKLENIDITKQYGEEDDAVLGLCKKIDKSIEMESGDYLILFPDEAHLPGIEKAKSTHNTKLVIKIPIQ